MNEDGRCFCCPRCDTRIGEIETDGALLMYPAIRIVEARMVCECGESLVWHSHPAALDRLVDRVLEMRSKMGSPCGMLT